MQIPAEKQKLLQNQSCHYVLWVVWEKPAANGFQ